MGFLFLTKDKQERLQLLLCPLLRRWLRQNRLEKILLKFKLSRASLPLPLWLVSSASVLRISRDV
jgi:hypothetical protein